MKADFEILKNIIEEVATSVGSSFDYGTRLQISNSLTEKDQSIAKQLDYPLVLLQMPFYNRPFGYGRKIARSEVIIYFAQYTAPELVNDQRYEEKFEPLLYPRFHEFTDALYSSVIASELLQWRDLPYLEGVELPANQFWDVLEATYLITYSNFQKC